MNWSRAIKKTRTDRRDISRSYTSKAGKRDGKRRKARGKPVYRKKMRRSTAGSFHPRGRGRTKRR